MRDLAVAGVIFGSIPFILRNPFVGLLMWVWVGIMNPHRLTWGFAYGMPFAQIIFLCMVVSMFINRARLHAFPVDRVTVFLVLFVIWLCISPLFSMHGDLEFPMWSKAFKVLFVATLAFAIVGTRDQLHKLVWVLALSMGYFSVKGGLFTLITGGHHRVYGPSGSFIGENNALAMATVITVPLIRYLHLQTTNAWIQRGCLAALVLSTASAIGSQSRGALLAVAAMLVFLWMKSRKKGLLGLLILIAVPVGLLLMPESWHSRMTTIETYDQDSSAMGRINSWWMAWNLAVDRFPIGGGFAMWMPDVFLRYAPDPSMILVAHSIYFQVLGEHGFMGLALFLAVFGLTWMNGSWIVRNTRGQAHLQWAHDLAAMCQVSLVGFAVGGAFLSLAYFDLPYYVVIILVVLRGLVRRELSGSPVAAAVAPPGLGVPMAGK